MQSRITNPAAELGIFLQDLHDEEISGSIEWLYDQVWTARIGNPVLAEDSFRTLNEVSSAAIAMPEASRRAPLFPWL
jgi:aminoglycoside phosphotransferase (APT) family kinase protein